MSSFRLLIFLRFLLFFLLVIARFNINQALITGVDTFTFLLLEAYGLRKLEALFAVLIATLSFSFGYMFYAHQTDTLEIVRDTVIPGIEGGNAAVEQAVGYAMIPMLVSLLDGLYINKGFDTLNADKVPAYVWGAIMTTVIALTLS